MTRDRNDNFSPLIGHTVTLHNDTRVKILGWLDKSNIEEIRKLKNTMFEDFYRAHPDIPIKDDKNILVGMKVDNDSGILVHISDIVGYVKMELPR